MEVVAYKDFHLLVEAIVHDERVAHADPGWLHGMTGPIVVVADVRVEKVADAGWVGAACGTGLEEGATSSAGAVLGVSVGG